MSFERGYIFVSLVSNLVEWLLSNGNFMLNIWGAFKLFQSGFTILQPHQKHTRVPVSLHPQQRLVVYLLHLNYPSGYRVVWDCGVDFTIL